MLLLLKLQEKLLTQFESSIEQGSMQNTWQKATVNHCAAIKKYTWQNFHYNEAVVSGEDKLWAYQVMKAGFAINVNIPLFYAYHKQITRSELIQKRAQPTHKSRKVTLS